MSNANNLKNGEATQFRTGEEQVEIARQGGIASGKARREKKSLRMLAEMLVGLEIKGKKNQQVLEALGIPEEEWNHKTLCVLGMIKEAEKGNVKAFEKVQELIGEDRDEEYIEDLSEAEERAFGYKDENA